MRSLRIFFIVSFVLFQFQTYADKLEKGFEKLKAFDYFAAKEYFEKSYKSETAAAAYGLGKIYSTDKNPFYNTDSARKFILISDSTFKMSKERKKKYYSKFGVTDSSIQNLTVLICEDAFNRSKNINSTEGFDHYLKYFKTCSQIQEVTALRNAAAFNDARTKNTSTAYKEFMALYPQSVQYKQALLKYDERIYEENTDGSIESFEYFIQNYPESPHRIQAEKMIYTQSVPDKTIEQYVAFARKFKDSPHNNEAWREVYKLGMKDFSERSFNEFKSTYPDYPFTDELETDFLLQNYFFLPFESEGKWGYINETGQEMIKPVYEEASLFSEGLAAVADKGNYGFINKAGKKIIKFNFKDAENFHTGTAVVMKDSLYGLINKSGEFIIQPKYEELTEASGDIFIAVKDDKSIYIKKNGELLSSQSFDVANDFINGNAIVNKDDKSGLLNAAGKYSIEPVFEELVKISDGLYKAMNEDELWGILNVHGDTVLSFSYDAIGEFGDHLAIITKNEKCGYVNEQGLVVIQLIYPYTTIMLTTGRFQNGFALLKQKIRSVIIDTTGKVFKFPGYEDYGRPSDGFIPVKKNRKWGFADMSGKIRIPCKFEDAGSFSHGFATIQQNKLSGLVDTTGNIFIAPLYENIVAEENAVVVRNGGKSGLFSRAGILLVPCVYDKIEFLTSSIARATNKSGFTYVNLLTGKIIYSSLK